MEHLELVALPTGSALTIGIPIAIYLIPPSPAPRARDGIHQRDSNDSRPCAVRISHSDPVDRWDRGGAAILALALHALLLIGRNHIRGDSRN